MKKYHKTSELTKKNFFDTFWQLYTTESNKITIKNICSIANYDRTTFYRYFTDISDLLDQFEDNLINSLRADIKNKGKSLQSISIDKFQHFSEKYGKYIIAFHDKGNTNFYEKFKELVINEVYNLLNFNIQGEENKDFLYEFLFSSIIISYSYWYKHPNIMPFKSYVKLLNRVLLDGSKTIISNLKCNS